MKEKSYAARLGALALALTLISTCLMGGTLAKYTTEITAEASATVAKWNFTANGKTDKITDLNLTPKKYTNVDDKMLAPGMDGSFSIVAKNDSDVAATYTVSFTATNVPANLKFYKSTDGTAKGTEITADKTDNNTYKVVTDQALAKSASETQYVIWDWPLGTAAESDQASATTSRTMTVSVKVTGTQVTPAE